VQAGKACRPLTTTLHYGNIQCIAWNCTMSRSSLLLLALATTTVGALPARAAEPLPVDGRLVLEHRAWVDDHARWNAQHLAAARRLEAVVAALRRHDTSFDRHGAELRQHELQVTKSGHGAATRARHARMRAAHAEAAVSHKRLMDEVSDLERTIAADLAADRFKSR
jgi:hypothetical protein